jgi:cobalt-zinc-cadmium efflux system protein
VDVAQVPARRLLQALGISAIITVAQVVGGLLAHSLALLSDALHTLTDGIALLVSYAALRLSSRPASEQFTFGLKRAETLAAIVNSGVLIGISLWLLYEAVSRLLHPEPVTGWIMVAVASVGLVANITNTLLLRRGAEKNLNMRSAYLHVMSDGVVSLAVIVGGAAIIYDPALRWIDPVLTFLISVWLIYESWSIVWSGTRVMLMSAPDDVAVRDIQAALEALPDVRNVHHVHLWVLNDESIHLEAHVDIADDRRVSETSALGKQIEELLREKWSVTHVTLQFECGCCGEKPALVAERE